MSDFHQSGIVPTLHRLPSGLPAKLESELEGFSQRRPITLALPALYSEFERPALSRIVGQLKDVGYLRQIVVSLDAAEAADFARAKEFLAQLPLHLQGRSQLKHGELTTEAQRHRESFQGAPWRNLHEPPALSCLFAGHCPSDAGIKALPWR